MKMFGSWKELASIVFRISSRQVTVAPVAQTVGDSTANLPDMAGTTQQFILTTQTQTLTNKTLTSPVVNTPTGITKSDVGLGNVDNTSDATKNAAAATLTNKTLTAPVINSPTGIVKGDVGLGNVDNTSDATKNAATVTLTNKTLASPVVTTTASFSNQASAKFLEQTGNGTNFIAIEAPDAVTTDTTFKLPNGDGTTGQVLKTDGSGNLGWVTAATSSVATSTASGTVTSFVPVIVSAVKTVSSADYTVLTADGYEEILVTTGASNRNVNLPAVANNAGRVLTIVKADSGAGFVVVDGNASETIGGALINTLHNQYSFVTIFCDGNAWFVRAVQDSMRATASVSTPVNTWTNIASVTLTPGIWDASGVVEFGPGTYLGGNNWRAAIDTSSTGSGSAADSQVSTFAPSGSSQSSAVIPALQIAITTTTTYYLNNRVDATSGSNTNSARLSLRRVG